MLEHVRDIESSDTQRGGYTNLPRFFCVYFNCRRVLRQILVAQQIFFMYYCVVTRQLNHSSFGNRKIADLKKIRKDQSNGKNTLP